MLATDRNRGIPLQRGRLPRTAVRGPTKLNAASSPCPYRAHCTSPIRHGDRTNPACPGSVPAKRKGN